MTCFTGSRDILEATPSLSEVDTSDICPFPFKRTKYETWITHNILNKHQELFAACYQPSLSQYGRGRGGLCWVLYPTETASPFPPLWGNVIHIVQFIMAILKSPLAIWLAPGKIIYLHIVLLFSQPMIMRHLNTHRINACLK